MPDKLQEWLELLGSQLQWKPGREMAVRELKAHILDQQEDFESQGMTAEDALTASLREMGDPVEIGAELDQLHRPKSCLLPLLVILALTILGISIQSALPVISAIPLPTFIKFCLLGAGLMLVLWRVNYTFLFRLGAPSLIVCAIVTIAYLLTSPTSTGMNFRAGQVLLLLPLLVVYALVRLQKQGGWKLALVCFAAMIAAGFYMLFLPSRMTAVFLFGLTSLVLTLMACAAGWFGPWKQATAAVLGICTAAALPCLALMISSGYLTRRLTTFITAEGDRGFYFRVLRGIGELESRTWYIQRQTDLSLAYLSDLVGNSVFMVSFAAIVILALLLWRRISRLHSVTGRLTATACALPLVGEALIFWLYNLGWFPASPMTMPFLSRALMLQVANYVLAGVLLSVFRHDSVVRDRSYSTKAFDIMRRLFGWQLEVKLTRKT